MSEHEPNPHHHSAMAAEIYEYLRGQRERAPMDAEVAIEIAELLERKYGIGIGRRL